MKLLTKAVCEARQELELDVERESGSGASRRLDALQMALYNVGKLEIHMHQSSRILNDLRTMRRLLSAERGAPRDTIPSGAQSVEHATAERNETQPIVDGLSV